MLIGGTCTGKFHLAIAIGRACVRNGARVRFYNMVDLVNWLEAEAHAGKPDHLSRLDLMILDELGYLPFALSGGQLLFQTAALLDPVVTRTRDAVLAADKIHADNTPVPVLDPGRGKTATGRLWVYATDNQASGSTAPRATWYRFTPDRTAAHPLSRLAGFRGFLQADAHAGDDGLYRSGVIEVACWANFQRKVFDPGLRRGRLCTSASPHH